jgi:hypothetical protein
VWAISHIYLIVNAVLFAIPATSPEFYYGYELEEGREEKKTERGKFCISYLKYYRRCYRRALFSGCVAYGTSLYKTFGVPPFSLTFPLTSSLPLSRASTCIYMTLEWTIQRKCTCERLCILFAVLCCSSQHCISIIKYPIGGKEQMRREERVRKAE